MGKLPVKSLVILILKSGKIFKLFKSLKFLKAGGSFLSMAVFAACYSTTMGITLAVAFTILILIHEMGHVLALKVNGYPLRLPLFIPFVGAIIFGERMKSRHTEAYVGISGPFIGTIASLLAAIPYFYTGEKVWLVAAFLGVMINLFNMIPISPLDGGRITQAIHANFKWVGIAMLLGITLMGGEPGMLIIWMAVVMDMEKIPILKRSKYIIMIWLLMAVLTFVGIGKDFWINFWDVLLGVILMAPSVVLLFSKDLRKHLEESEAEEEQFKRVDCSPKQKRQWFYSWAGLTAAQVACMFILAPMIKPKPMMEPESMTFYWRSETTNHWVFSNMVFYIESTKTNAHQK